MRIFCKVSGTLFSLSFSCPFPFCYCHLSTGILDFISCHFLFLTSCLLISLLFLGNLTLSSNLLNGLVIHIIIFNNFYCQAYLSLSLIYLFCGNILLLSQEFSISSYVTLSVYIVSGCFECRFFFFFIYCNRVSPIMILVIYSYLRETI